MLRECGVTSDGINRMKLNSTEVEKLSFATLTFVKMIGIIKELKNSWFNMYFGKREYIYETYKKR